MMEIPPSTTIRKRVLKALEDASPRYVSTRRLTLIVYGITATDYCDMRNWPKERIRVRLSNVLNALRNEGRIQSRQCSTYRSMLEWTIKEEGE